MFTELIFRKGAKTTSKYVMVILVLSINAACSKVPSPAEVTSVPQVETPVVTSTRTQVSFDLTLTPTYTPIPTETLSPTPTAPLGPVFTEDTLSVQQLCPYHRMRLISELEIPPEYRLLLLSIEDEHQLWYLPGGEDELLRYPNIISDAWLWGNIAISPNRKWFTYPKLTQNAEGKVDQEFWVGSVDGKQQWKWASRLEAGLSAKWYADESVDLWKRVVDVSDGCYQRMYQGNPFQKSLEASPEMPKNENLPTFYGQYCAWPNWIMNPEHSKVIYPVNGDPYSSNWVMQTLQDGATQQVMPWIQVFVAEAVKKGNYLVFNVKWTEKGLSFILLTPGGFNIVSNIPEGTLYDSEVNITRYKVTGAPSYFNDRLQWWSNDGLEFGLDLFNREYDWLEVAKNRSIPLQFVSIDIKDKILHDYCLNRRSVDEITGDISTTSLSPDGRFLAWEVDAPGQGRVSPLDIMVLDLETGLMARLNQPGYNLYSWGDASNNTLP